MGVCQDSCLARMHYLTMLACSFSGFAEGFGIGIGVAVVVYFVHRVNDSISLLKTVFMDWRLFASISVPCCERQEWNETHVHQSQDQGQHTPTHRISPLNRTPSTAYPLTNVTLTDIESGGSSGKNRTECLIRDIRARVVVIRIFLFCDHPILRNPTSRHEDATGIRYC
ncbi:hypothetical protein IW261DRAFT_936242 [Armillaria novae-zelandiae]|uniref:Uncharacterized protein n=1 Tax=Armillaria novae-zelandiae TaxID=153914 RepID=A0AA39PGP7_9AGAR|nr:hypothetical protein IW261DRAFT_936242 [Armillaria novae-zelandiae]